MLSAILYYKTEFECLWLEVNTHPHPPSLIAMENN